jgi:hypothetical protein
MSNFGVYVAINVSIFYPDKVRGNLDRNWFEGKEK